MKKSNNDDNDKNHSDNNDTRSDSSIFYKMVKRYPNQTHENILLPRTTCPF